MASSPSHLCTATLRCKKPRFSRSFQVKAQSYRDHQGKSSNMVDANLRVLRERIEQVKDKERLERCCLAEPGWNYATYDQSFKYKSKRDQQLIHHHFLQLLGIVSGTFGLTILSCSFCLCIASFLLHLNQ
ncbi:hypothetical protein CDL12_19175 [Handroanthus impetiginosus]|uniref:Uncharacterized protein n=1 Tax=Handroanthus impetiginosus TaxID=429701 RepID=A0A2G9GSL9_9LAMI|nr:hypothetical protein CDL12_19175 [Handroanthus impetiginosus]